MSFSVSTENISEKTFQSFVLLFFGLIFILIGTADEIKISSVLIKISYKIPVIIIGALLTLSGLHLLTKRFVGDKKKDSEIPLESKKILNRIEYIEGRL